MFTITVRMNCALSLAGRKTISLAGRKTNQFYPKIIPLSNYENK